jgi:hypothetical protein
MGLLFRDGAGGKWEGQGTTRFPRPLVVHWTGHVIAYPYCPENRAAEAQTSILADYFRQSIDE